MSIKIKNLISVILPTFNRGNFLAPCIDKILESDYSEKELIVVNDASTDNTSDILLQYKNHSNLKIINLKKNSNTVCIPRNIGISHSSGEFIAHADDDVITHKKKFTILTELLSNNVLCPLAYGNRRERWKDGFTKVAQFIPSWNPNVRTGIDNGQILYRSSVYNHIPFVWFYRACDSYLSKEIFNKIGSFCCTTEVVSTYLWHDNNRSLTTDHLYNHLKTQEIPQHIIDSFKEYINDEYFNNFI